MHIDQFPAVQINKAMIMMMAAAAVKVLLKVCYGILPKSTNTVLSNRLYGQVSAMCSAYFLK